MRQFTINRGKHYCRYWWTKVFSPRWNHKKWEVSFIIDKDNWVEQISGETINKLIGVGFGFNHHKNSWRLGIRYNFSKKNWYYLYAYVYDETDSHIATLIGEVEGGKLYYGTVESVFGQYIYKFPEVGIPVYMPNKHKDWKLQFELWPYHGGHNTAPKLETFFIDLKYL